MKKTKVLCFAFMVLFAAAATLWGQDGSERVAVPFSDPAKPGLVKAHLINGGILVTGYDGKEVIVETKSRSHIIRDKEDEDADEKEAEKKTKHAGMIRLKASGGGLNIEEKGNVVTISVPAWKADIDLAIQVPASASLELHTVNGATIKVENIAGRIEVSNVNGAIALSRVSGAVVAHTVNGDVTATFVRLDGKTPISLVTLNGDVDITIPPAAKVNFKLRIDNEGEIYSDFELALQSKSDRSVEDRRDQGGHYHVRIEKAVFGSINGGGQEITLKTFNGDILLRKGK